MSVEKPELAKGKGTSRWPLVGAGVIALITMVVLRAEGRVWWCQCGRMFLWTSDIWSEHCSQHLGDPYVFSHMSHGFWFYGLLMWLPLKYRRVSFGWAMFIATLVECAWEVLENSSLVIQRYRAQTISIGYTGDGVINSMGDIAACMIGVCIARWLGLWKTVLLFVVFEVGTLLWVKDNLTLNVIMLVWPVEAIKKWQEMGHGVGM